jgi:hypothetical protein
MIFFSTTRPCIGAAKINQVFTIILYGFKQNSYLLCLKEIEDENQ